MTQPGDRLVGAYRVVTVLRRLAAQPSGVSLQELSVIMKTPKSTIHRDLAVLCRSGLAAHDEHGWYRLGDDFLRLAFEHYRARPLHAQVTPVLRKLSARYQEAAHYAVLEGRDIVYRDKVAPSRAGIVLNSTIGGRSPAHSTAIGKVLLARQLPDVAAVRLWVGGRRLEQRTERTVRSAAALHRELELTRQRGFGVDDQENELGVNCIAFEVFLDWTSAEPSGAVSVSAVAHRMPLDRLLAEAPRIREQVDALHTAAPRDHAGRS